MPAKKKASKKKTASRKKTTAKKTTSKKKKVAKKAAAKKTSTKKKVAKKTVTKKTSTKKTTKKAVKKAPRRKPKKQASNRNSTLESLAGIPAFRDIEPYKPKRGEEYMSDEQQEHFRIKLLAWKKELMQEVDRTVHHMKDEAANFPDPNDRATQESEFSLELRTRDRERKLLRKIDSALSRIDDGSYGFCEETGDEIGLKRLEARPVATLSLEAQERRELAERQYRDDR